MTVTDKYKNHNIVFFDGFCNFCNRSVDLIFKNNRRRDIFFSPLQSHFAKEFLGDQGISCHNPDTIIFYTSEKFYFRSTAVLQISKHLSGGYNLLSALLIVPSFIRDGVYKWASRNRNSFLGTSDTCHVPSADEKKYFLE